MRENRCATCQYGDTCCGDSACEYYDPIIESGELAMIDAVIEAGRLEYREEWWVYMREHGNYLTV